MIEFALIIAVCLCVAAFIFSEIKFWRLNINQYQKNNTHKKSKNKITLKKDIKK